MSHAGGHRDYSCLLRCQQIYGVIGKRQRYSYSEQRHQHHGFATHNNTRSAPCTRYKPGTGPAQDQCSDRWHDGDSDRSHQCRARSAA